MRLEIIMVTRVATLGMKGFVEDIDEQIDYLMCCFFYSKYSQTILFRTRITSLPKIVQMNYNDANGIRTEMKRALEAFLNRSFASSEVTVIETSNDDDPGINLQITAIVSRETATGTISTSIGYALTVRDSKLRQLVNLNSNVTLISL